MLDRKTKIVALISFAYLFIVIAIFSWGIYELLKAGKVLEERIVAIEETNAKIKANKDLEVLVLETQEQRSLLETYVLTEPETSTFLTNIETLAREQNVTLTTKSLKSIEVKDAPNKLEVQFEIEGTEEQIKNMLLLFESLPYLSSVSSYQVSKESDGSFKSMFTLEVTLLEHETE